MMRGQALLSPEVRALLDREREAPPLPPAVRARAVARARAALTAGSVGRSFLASSPPVRRIRWAAAAGMALLASGAVAAGYEIRSRLHEASEDRAAPRPPVAPRSVARTESPSPFSELEAPAPIAPSTGDGRRLGRGLAAPRLSRAEAVRAELRLLREARAAVAREDYAAALSPIAEHARRFKEGRLAEEREALRVKALVGLGRSEEARRAAAAFEARFPHSVLLPAVRQM